MLTTSAMYHQGVLKRMNRCSLTASQNLFLTSLFTGKCIQHYNYSYRSAHLVSTSCWGSSLRCSICWKLYACCQLDLELTSQITDFNSSSFSKYSQVLQRLPLFQADLETAQHAHEVLQQVATYVALVHGKKNPLAVDLLKQSAAKKRPVKALVSHYPTCTIVFKLVIIGSRSGQMHSNLKRGYSEKAGPLSRHLTMHYNHLEFNDSSILGGHLLATMYTRH